MGHGRGLGLGLGLALGLGLGLALGLTLGLGGSAWGFGGRDRVELAQLEWPAGPGEAAGAARACRARMRFAACCGDRKAHRDRGQPRGGDGPPRRALRSFTATR